MATAGPIVSRLAGFKAGRQDLSDYNAEAFSWPHAMNVLYLETGHSQVRVCAIIMMMHSE